MSRYLNYRQICELKLPRQHLQKINLIAKRSPFLWQPRPIFNSHHYRYYSKPSSSPLLSKNTFATSNVTTVPHGAVDIALSLLKYVWPKNDWNTKARVVGAISLLICGKLLGIQVPYLFKQAIDSLNVYVPTEQGEAFFTVAGAILLGYGAARAGSFISQELRNALFSTVSQKVIRTVARNTFSHLLTMDLSFHFSRQTGGLMRIIERGTKGISFILSAMVLHIVPTTFEISLVCGILAVNYGWAYSAVALASMFSYTSFTFAVTQWRTKFRKQMNRADNQAASTALDTLLNIEAVKLFKNESLEIMQYDNALKKYQDASLKIQSSLAFLNAGQNLIFSCALTGIMWLAAHGVMEGTLTVGDLVMVNGLIFQLSFPLNFLGSVYRDLRQSVTDMEALFSYNRLTPVVKDSSNAGPLLLEGSPAIEFKNVTFGYPTSMVPRKMDGKSSSPSTSEDTPKKGIEHRNILNEISFKIPSGSKMAIVGPSGCGKSTVLRLLYRFYDPKQGTIYINEKPVTDFTIESVRKAIAVVPQDTVLFNQSIYHNIAYGNIYASKEEVIEAAKRANIHNTIMSMPKGYETPVGERGLMISGGEKQRISLARIFLHNPKILLFDEATSSLDANTEGILLESIKSFSNERKCTTLFIAHRLRTIMDSDIIVVLNKEGRVEESGTHSSLIRIPNGKYSKMWAEQNMAHPHS